MIIQASFAIIQMHGRDKQAVNIASTHAECALHTMYMDSPPNPIWPKPALQTPFPSPLATQDRQKQKPSP